MENQSLVSRIARFSLDRKVTMFVVFLTILAVGLISTNRLPLEMNPRGMEGHYIEAGAQWNSGVPPESMDKVGLPLEEELSTVRGLKHISTGAHKSGARVQMEFKYGTDMDVAYREVRDRVERARPSFPEGTDKPYIRKYQPGAEPVVGFRISYDQNSDYYDLINKYVVMPLQRIAGVADVDFRIYQREIRIEVDKARAEAFGINIKQLGNTLRSDNFTLASGNVIDGGKKYTLKSSSEFKTIDEIRHIPLKSNVFLKDVAIVSYVPEEADRLYRYDSKPANGVSVKKEGEANTVEVSERVTDVIEEIKQNPKLEGFDISIYDNQGEEITERLDSLISNGNLGACLAAIVLFFFLRQFRMTMVIAMAIPLCLLIALTAMFFAGETLNSLTIMGLVICVGLLVDNSVVVAENIHRHHQNGLSRRESCLKGVSEIGFAITIATLTTLIVFSSALMVDGEMKFMIQKITLPVISSIVASLGIALMFIPLCVYVTLPRSTRDFKTGRKTPLAVLGKLFYRIYSVTFEPLNRAYNAALKFFLGRRLDMAVILIALLSGTFILSGTLNTSDRNEDRIRKFSFDVRFPDNYSMDQRLAYMKKAEALAEKNRDVYGFRVHSVHYGKWYGKFEAYFAHDRVHKLTRDEAIDQFYNDFPEEPGVRVRYKGKEGEEQNDDHKNMHHIRLVGDDPELLKKVAEDLKPTFENIPGVVSFLEKDSDEAPSELALIVDRDKANSIGVNPRTLAGTISAAVGGDNLPRFNGKSRQIPMRLRFQEEDRSELADLSNFQVPTEDGRVSSVGEVTKVTFTKNENTYISRRDKKISEYFGMKLKPGPDSWKIKRAIEEAKNHIDLPEGVSFDRAKVKFGDDERAKGSMMITLSILFVYMLMAFFFESTLIPLSIILTIPLASIGAIIALKVTNTYVDQMVYMGAMFLVGIVVNNGIVLVDYANRLRRSGTERSEALLTAAKHRFRPIVMTALTTMCGMIPLTFGDTPQMDVNFKSFGLVLIGGMASATLFTLVVVPVFYTLIEDAQKSFSNILASVFDRSSKVPVDDPSLS
jgi:hydrophobic/amphiphilic exporter-1 (mainly G- bacteria), HAE1 family